MGVPPVCPTEASQGGSPFTPLIGVPMELGSGVGPVWQACVVNFGQCQKALSPTILSRIQRPSSGQNVQTHPLAHCWARATFEQGSFRIASLRRILQISLPGEHLFHAAASRLTT